jgi:anti-sigma B factor antagonist
MSAKVGVRETQGVTVVEVSGRLTLGEGVAKVRSELQPIIAGGKRQIVLDISEVVYLDSSGIGLLVSTYATMNRLGGHLKICGLSNRVKDLLLLTKLFTVFEVYDNADAAVASFSNQQQAARNP